MRLLRVWIRVLLIFVIMMTLFASVGCEKPYDGKYEVRGGEGEETDNSFSMQYEDFNGFRLYTIELKTRGIIGMNFKNEAGRLGCAIMNSEGERIFLVGVVEDGHSDFAVGAGTYTVRLTAEHHKGSYRIAWSEVGNA